MKEIALETLNLSKSFGAKKAVDGVNLQVEAGDVYGFLGPNGSGKTTTIRMLLNLIFPDEGQIRLHGFDVRTHFVQAIAQVGAIVETPQFYTYFSGRQNIEQMANLVPDLPKNRVDEVLELVGLANRAKDRVRTYSLGMKQRLGIARALLHRPKLVILDEPTNGLDPQGMKEVRELIARLAREEGITFFISTHLLHEVEQVCNKVGILQHGRLLAQGSVQELLKSDEEVVEVWTPAAEQALDLLHDSPLIHSVSPSEQGIRVKLARGGSAHLNQFLVANKITVDYLVPVHQSLEKFFLELTREGGDQIV